VIILPDQYPTAADLLAASPDEVATLLLELAPSLVQGGMVMPTTVNLVALGDETYIPATDANPTWHTVGVAPESRPYPPESRPAINALLDQAWAHLYATNAVTPATGLNGSFGWVVITGPAAAAPEEPPPVEPEPPEETT
jgi:hypothetical protein